MCSIDFDKMKESDNNAQAQNEITSVKDFYEVIPELPTYCYDGLMGFVKVIKYLYNPYTMRCEKLVVQTDFGWCDIMDNDINSIEACTLPEHPNTIRRDFVDLLTFLNDDKIKYAEEELLFWGITKVYCGNNCERIIDLHDYLCELKKVFIDHKKDYVMRAHEELEEMFNRLYDSREIKA